MKYLKSYKVVVHFSKGAKPNDFVNVLAYDKAGAIQQARKYWSKTKIFIDKVKRLDKN